MGLWRSYCAGSTWSFNLTLYSKHCVCVIRDIHLHLCLPASHGCLHLPDVHLPYCSLWHSNNTFSNNTFLSELESEHTQKSLTHFCQMSWGNILAALVQYSPITSMLLCCMYFEGMTKLIWHQTACSGRPKAFLLHGATLIRATILAPVTY